MTRIAALLALLTFAACGADGSPKPPDGVSVHGTASAGVVIR